MIDRSAIFKEVNNSRKKYPNLRYGQAIANVASNLYPRALNLFGTEFDCFYHDDRVEIFLEKVDELYPEE